MPMPVISIDSVSKRFGSETAVDELSFGVEAGQAALVLTAWRSSWCWLRRCSSANATFPDERVAG